MPSSLSNLVHNLAEGTDKIKCKCGHKSVRIKIMKLLELNTKIVSVALNKQTLKMI